MNNAPLFAHHLMETAAYVGLYLVVFLLAKWFKDLFTSYKINVELTQTDNLAIALTMSGYYLATAAIFVGAMTGSTHSFMQDFVQVALYSMLGLGLLNMARWINDHTILRHFNNTEQLVKERNLSIGAVQCGAYLATGIIAAGAVSGTGGGAISAIVFFVLGQASLGIFSFIYEKFSLYNVQEELRQKNTACGVAYAGNLIALSIIIMNASSGDFVNWRVDLGEFAFASIGAFVFLPLIRRVMDRLVVPNSSLGKEIQEDRNIGAGFLEATIAISFAVILIRLV